MNSCSLFTQKATPTEPGAYAQSDAFKARLRFDGPDALQDQVQVALYLLGRLALDPLEIAAVQLMLRQGIVILNYYGASNPVPHFEVSVGSVAHSRLLAAVNANLASEMFKAAQRVRKQRQPAVRNRRAKQEGCVLDKLRKTLPWPAGDGWGTPLSAEVQGLRDASSARLEEKIRELRDRHQRRIARLEAATAPGMTSWMALLDDIAQHLLSPETLH